MAVDMNETEAKYEAPAGRALPDLDDLPQVAGTSGPDEEQLEAEYYDTGDLRLIRAGITLRRRRGGHDAGWHLKLPVGPYTRREIRLPLDRAGVAQARVLAERYGVRGFKFHPNVQGFYPNDRMAYGLYEAIEDLGGIALFHTGQTGIGAGVPGGGGIRLKYSNPLYVDDVAADFPGLKIILAHPSFPWQDEALSIATHKPGVYIDLSGWSPKYFPPQLIQYANTLLQDKVLFGSDFPLLTPDRWLADFAALPIKDEVRPKILKQNAARLLGLLPAASA